MNIYTIFTSDETSTLFSIIRLRKVTDIGKYGRLLVAHPINVDAAFIYYILLQPL